MILKGSDVVPVIRGLQHATSPQLHDLPPFFALFNDQIITDFYPIPD
jgi:hypothetical protein